MTPWRAISELAIRQAHCVTRSQLRGLGLSAATIDRLVATGGLTRLHRGVYALAGSTETPTRRAMAAWLAVGAPSALTGLTVLTFNGSGNAGATVPEATKARPHLVVPRRREIRIPGIRVQRTRYWESLRLRHETSVGPACTALPEAFAFAAAHLDARRLARLLSRLHGQRRLRLDDIHELLGDWRHFTGRGRLAHALADARGELSHSAEEARARQLIRELGARPHPRPYPVFDRGDHPLAEIDVAVPEFLYGAEIDGPHHDLPEQQAADKARDRELHRRGWHIDRFPVEMVSQEPARFQHEVAQGLEAARHARSGRGSPQP